MGKKTELTPIKIIFKKCTRKTVPKSFVFIIFKNLTAVRYVNRYLKDFLAITSKITHRMTALFECQGHPMWFFPMAGVDTRMSFIEECVFHNIIYFSFR